LAPPYDGPPYPYTTVIPGGVRELRAWIEREYPRVRTEVLRDRARCADNGSEHCACRAIDAYTNSRDTRGRIFGDLVRFGRELGVQSVIADRRVWGYGQDQVRTYTGDHPHDDHVHIGVTIAASRTLTVKTVEATVRGSGPKRGRIPMDWTYEDIADAVWGAPLPNAVTNQPETAGRTLAWAHLDAFTSHGGLAAIGVRLDAIAKRLDAIEVAVRADRGGL
jgi:hypothetical protein